MKIQYLLYLLGVGMLVQACTKDHFDYVQTTVKKEAIDTLIFNTSHYILNADGRSTLNYYLMPSSENAYVPLSFFNREDYAYFYEEEDGTIVEVENEYLVFGPETAHKKIKVFARVFDQETRKIEVEIRKPWGEEVQPKTIPIIFHVFQYTGTENTEFVIEQIHLIDRVRKLNNAYSRLISTGAAATDSKIRFELATHTPQGRPLMVAGMNRMDFGAKELNTEDFVDFYQDGEFDWSAFFKFYEADWDPNKFLNIWILPTGKVKIPSYVPSVIQAGKAPLKGLKMNEVDEYYIPKLTECGIVINYSSFLNVKMNAVIGKFLGLLPTSNASGTVGGDSDYCSDTFLYSKDESKEERKQGLNQPISFISDNIMDETTQDISVTNEQAERMNYILENVPTRRMWKVAE